MTATRREQMWRWSGLCLVALISFILVRIAVLNVFYDSGDMRDPGWLASVAWHNGWRLHAPPSFGGSYFSEHVTLIFWITNAVSYVVPLDKFESYAAFNAAIYALYAAGIYRAWLLTDRQVTAARVTIAAIVALAATFSAIGMEALRLPHQEMAIPALTLWFLIALVQRNYVTAAFWFALCLMVREDAGLHMFALLALWAAVLLLQGRRASVAFHPICRFAAIALGYAAVAFLAKHLLFPSGDVLTRSYLGNPILAHVTAAFVGTRLHYYLIWRSYVLLPLVLSLAWATITRNPLLPLGYIAAVPWLVVSLLAVHVTPGTMTYYMGFPFWLALAWPLIAVRVGQDTAEGANQRWPYVLLLLASTIGWHPDRIVIYPLDQGSFRQQPFRYTEALSHRADYREFVDTFVNHRAVFGMTAVDQPMVGLLIDHIDRSNWSDDWQSAPPDTLIYFADSPFLQKEVLPLLNTGKYRCIYSVPGTRIRLATQDALRERLPDPAEFSLEAHAPDLPDMPAVRC